ncbi:hypothetical protein NBRC10513v2_001824 [Rhodotorula toruloides]|uniref:Uncharacterized protein n=1 Tax=Rhodotorula toruloides TaxID=5286 RepID=A0A0K3CHK7_RHOTO
MSSSASERTLAVLFAPEDRLAAPYARDVVTKAGFRLLKEASVSGEELEEAGVDLGLGVGEEGAANASAAEQEHTVWVLEKQDAVAELKRLQSTSIAQDCSNLRMFAAPTLSAATMAINELFPSLPASPTPASPANVAFPTAESPTASKPFALSNAAFTGKVQPAPKATTLSPAIEKALAEVEEREERERLRKLSRSSRSSRASTASPLTVRQEAKTAEGTQTPERRVFTNRSPTPEEFDPVEDDEEPVEVLEEPQEVQEEEVERFETAAPPAPPIAPPLRRATSAMSGASLASSTSSATAFRARPAPSFTPSATSQPRLTKAAALRLGVSLPPSTPRRSTITPSETGTSDASSQAPSRAAVSTPKSLAAPAITPRLTKTAALRTGQTPAALDTTAAKPRVRQSISTAERAARDRQQRRHSVATTAPSAPPAPAVEVRMSRAAMLRQAIALPPTTPRRAPPASTKENRPSSSMSASSGRASIVSSELKALREPSITPRMTKSVALRNGAGRSGRASVAGVVGRFAQEGAEGASGRPASSLAASIAPATPKARPAPTRTASTLTQSTSRPPIPSTSAPALTPRTNKAAELRAKLKLAKEAEAAKKEVGLKKGPPPALKTRN